VNFCLYCRPTAGHCQLNRPSGCPVLFIIIYII
jgi:hypothetical protein